MREDDLIIIEAFVVGPKGQAKGRFALDTGASVTTIIPEVADEIAYSIRDALKRARVRTALGSEEGYWLNVAKLNALGFGVERFPVQVFDLGYSDLSGLLGMNFLKDFNFEVRPADQKILLEKILL